MTPEEVLSAVFADGGLLPALDNGLEDSLLTDNKDLRWSYAEMLRSFDRAKAAMRAFERRMEEAGFDMEEE